MELGLGIKLTGWVLLILTAVGFLIESAPMFLVALVLLIIWVAYVINAARTS